MIDIIVLYYNYTLLILTIVFSNLKFHENTFDSTIKN